jgi:hypothetical protein
MEFSGLIGKYPTNRTLTEQERAHQLEQRRRLTLTPHYQLSVIKMNSTFLETVDKWYAWKGAATTFTLVIILAICNTLGWLGFELVLEGLGVLESALDSVSAIANGLGLLGVVLIFLVLLAWILRKESFAYTHYPVRYNRKNRTVYFFRTDGTASSCSWDNLFFTLVHIPVSNLWEVRAHVLDPSRQTVCETFALSYSGTLDASDVACGTTDYSSSDFVRAHWEFIRRYMEEGPQEISKQVQFCMPIDRKRESVRLSFERIFANFAGGPTLLYIVMFPFCFVISLFRLFAIHTSKIPVWPAEVEASCMIEPDDPYAIEGAADGERVSVYPESARAAGVRCVST